MLTFVFLSLSDWPNGKIKWSGRAISKMNLLHDYDIVFTHDDNLKNWGKEYPFGVIVSEDLKRADYRTEDDFDDKVFCSTDTGGLTELEWEGSCARIGFHYSRGTTLQQLKSDLRTVEGIEDLAELMEYGLRKKKKKVETDQESMSKPWTWEGAPEFKDWTFHDSQSPEIALLQYQTIQTEITIKEVSNEEREPSTIKITDSEGLNWLIRIEMVEEEYDGENHIGCTVILDSPLSSQYLFGCRECDRDAIPMCPVVGIFALKNEVRKTHLFIDFSHVFTEQNTNSQCLKFWGQSMRNVVDECDEVKIKFEMRILRQKLIN